MTRTLHIPLLAGGASADQCKKAREDVCHVSTNAMQALPGKLRALRPVLGKLVKLAKQS